jgi:hypothetical protein
MTVRFYFFSDLPQQEMTTKVCELRAEIHAQGKDVEAGKIPTGTYIDRMMKKNKREVATFAFSYLEPMGFVMAATIFNPDPNDTRAFNKGGHRKTAFERKEIHGHVIDNPSGIVDKNTWDLIATPYATLTKGWSKDKRMNFDSKMVNEARKKFFRRYIMVHGVYAGSLDKQRNRKRVHFDLPTTETKRVKEV